MDKKKAAISVIIGLVMIVGVMYFVFVSSATKIVPVTQVAERSFKENILASAKVAPPVRDLNFEVGGKLEKVYVKEGDLVKEGQVIAELVDTALVAQLDQAEAGYQAALESVKIAQVGQSDAQIQVDMAELNLQKLREGATAAQRNSAQAIVDQARTNLDSAETNYANVIKMANDSADQADLAVDTADQTVEDVEDIADASEAAAEQGVDDAEQLVEDTQEYYDSVVQLAASGEVGYNSATVALAKIQLDTAEAALNQAEIGLDLVQATNEQSINAAESGYDMAIMSQDSIDTINQQNQDMAASQVEAAKKTLALAEAQYAQVTEPARNEDVGILQDQVSQAKNNEKRAAQTVSQLKAMSDSAKAAVTMARDRAEAATMTAPVAGKISQVNGKEGELIAPAAPGLGAKPFVKLIDVDKVELEAEVDDNDIGKILLGQDVNTKFDAFPNRNFSGKVVEIPFVSTVNTVGDTVFKIKVELATLDPELRVGIEGDSFVRTETKNQLVIPVDAVIKLEGRTFVMIEDKGKVFQQRVQLGARSGDEYAVISGVGKDQNIVAKHDQELKNGQTVVVK